MKATIKGIEVEGTPEEINQLIFNVNNQSQSLFGINIKSGTYLFVGEDKSMGFKRAKRYNLIISNGANGKVFVNYPKFVPYLSSDLFLENWMTIK